VNGDLTMGRDLVARKLRTTDPKWGETVHFGRRVRFHVGTGVEKERKTRKAWASQWKSPPNWGTSTTSPPGVEKKRGEIIWAQKRGG